MSVGKMTAFIDIIETVKIKDTDGFGISQDNILASVRAYLEDRHGNVMWANRAAFSIASTLFRVRVIPNVVVTTQNQIICNGERFRIFSVENVRGKGMYIEVLAERLEATKNG
jgi:head-tail adaptor